MRKYITKFNTPGIFSFLSQGAQMGFGFLSFLLLVRILEQNDFGVWVLYMTLISITDMMRIGLVQNGMVKFCKDHPDEAPNIIAAGYWLNILSGIGLAGLLILLGQPLSALWAAPELFTLLLFYPFYVLIFGSARFIDTLHIKEVDFKGVFLSHLTYGVLFTGLIIYKGFFIENLRLVHLPILQIIAAAGSLLVIIFYNTARLTFGKAQKRWKVRLFDFGKYVMGTNLSSMVLNKMDAIILGTFLTPLAVGLYNVASRITNFMEVPMNSMAQVVYPKMAQQNSTGSLDAIGQFYEKGIGTLFALVLPVCLGSFFFADNIIVLVAGADYLSATPVLRILCISILIKPWGRLFGITLDAIGQPRLNFLFLVGSLSINLILNILFVTRWGIQGVAFATLLSVWISILVGQLMIKRFIPINHINIFKYSFAFYLNLLK